MARSFNLMAEKIQTSDALQSKNIATLEANAKALLDAAETEEKTRQLTRRDIAEYYLGNLDNFPPTIAKNPTLQELRKGLQELLPLVDVPEGKALNQEEVKALYQKASTLSHIITDKMNG